MDVVLNPFYYLFLKWKKLKTFTDAFESKT